MIYKKLILCLGNETLDGNSSTNPNVVVDYELFNVQDQKILKIWTYEKWEVFFDKYWIFIDAIIYSFLPFILLTSLNTLIFISIKKGGKRILKYKFKNS